MKGSSVNTETYLGLTFVFPGKVRTLRDSRALPLISADIAALSTAVIARELLKGDLLSLVTAESAQEHDERLSACPDLIKLIYLTEALIAQILMDSGVRPALLLGHSFESRRPATAAHSIEKRQNCLPSSAGASVDGQPVRWRTVGRSRKHNEIP